jgi:four helix bundle protein
MDLLTRVHALSKSFPKEELYALTVQLRRSLYSVASNIAEGWGRGTRKDYAQFVAIARGSALEASTQFEIACRIGLVSAEDARPIQQDLDRLERMLASLRRRLAEPAEPTSVPINGAKKEAFTPEP